MDADDVGLTTVLTEAYVMFVPPWQRRYAWEQAQWEKLWLSLDRVKTGPSGQYFLGAIVTQEAGKEGPVLQRRRIIDGQQRLVTLSLFVAALQQRADHLQMNALAPELLRLLWADQVKGTLRVTPWGHDEAPYRLCISAGGTPVGRIGEAFTFFETKLDRYNKAQINTLWSAVSSRIFFAYVLLDTGDDAHQIFQALNDTGKLLSATDIIRNHLFFVGRQDRGRALLETLGAHGVPPALQRASREFPARRGCPT